MYTNLSEKGTIKHNESICGCSIFLSKTTFTREITYILKVRIWILCRQDAFGSKVKLKQTHYFLRCAVLLKLHFMETM